MKENKEMTMEELERKMMQQMYKELKRDNIPSVDGEVYLSDGVVLTPSGDIIEHKPIESKGETLKTIYEKQKYYQR